MWNLVEAGDGAHGALAAVLRIEHAARTPVGCRVAAIEGEVAVQPVRGSSTGKGK